MNCRVIKQMINVKIIQLSMHEKTMWRNKWFENNIVNSQLRRVVIFFFNFFWYAKRFFVVVSWSNVLLFYEAVIVALQINSSSFCWVCWFSTNLQIALCKNVFLLPYRERIGRVW